MAKVEVYYWTTCPYCQRARKLLDDKGVKYEGYNLDGDEPARDKMAKRTGGKKSVPQIFIDGKHIGGSDDLMMLDANGELDKLLA